MQLPARVQTRSVWLARLTPEGELPPEEPPPLAGDSWPAPAPRSGSASGIADQLEAPEPGVSRPVRVRRWPAVLVVLILAGGAAGAIAWWARGGSERRPPVAVAPDAPAVVRIAAADAAPAPAIVIDAAAPPATADASPPTPAPAQRDKERERDAQRRDEIARHLAVAEAAYRVGPAKKLRQLTEANFVLDLDKHHPRANFLAGDALIHYGDRSRGCAFLRKARGVAQARERMTEAGCK